MTSSTPRKPPLPSRHAAASAATSTDRYKWNLTDIFPDWEAWEAGYKAARRGNRSIRGAEGHAGARGRPAARGVPAVRGARPARLSRLVFPVAPVRRGSARQQRQRAAPAGADPVRQVEAGGVVVQPGAARRFRSTTVRGWMDDDAGSGALPVRDRGSLPAAGARARRGGRAADVALEPAGVVAERRLLRRCRRPTRSFRTITLSNGEEVTVSYGQYRAILATRREQADRAAAFLALHDVYQASLNTYATLYNGVCQRDWFQARARGYESTLEAALHGDNIPTSVVENLIETTRAGVEPLRRYHRLRRRSARRALVSRLRLLDPDRHLRPEVPVRRRCSTGSSRPWRRSAPSIRRACGRVFRAAGSTSTRTRASGRARTRRRCTARTRTCS